jgi:hypothetical protein
MRIKARILFVFLTLICAQQVRAQGKKTDVANFSNLVGKASKSDVYEVLPTGIIMPVSVDLNWKPILSNKCIRHKAPNEGKLEQIKNQKENEKLNAKSYSCDTENRSLSNIITPVVGANFLGNTNTGSSPLDNSIAISNGGKIISVANNSIEFYNTNGVLTYSNSIDGFFNDQTISNVCDPVVIYDSGADKFIFFAQECSGISDNTHLLICFSVTNDPNGSWWKYKINGNPVSNNTWFDYPKLAISNNELYISGNSFSNEGIFEEALLYQIEKNNGYLGGNLNLQYWHNINDGSIFSEPFTLLPVSYGQQGNYGPGIYLVSTDASGSSDIHLYDLTNDMSSSNEELIHYNVSTPSYSPVSDGFQLGTTTRLDNGDCRALSGFYLDGIIHFVFHSEYDAGYNGINYNRLDVASQVNTSSVFGQVGYDYSYPSVASFANNSSDKSVMIGFGRTGTNIFPEVRVVNCDNNMNWSSSVQVKSGAGFSEYTASNGGAERWGDYTGMCRRHNGVNSKVWMNGMYGTTNNDWETWIAEIGTNSGSTQISEIDQKEKFQVYPNPIYQEFKMDFDLKNSEEIRIDIYDNNGKLIANLYRGMAHLGNNQFAFNKKNLEKGQYFISVSSKEKKLFSEKIIISD